MHLLVLVTHITRLVHEKLGQVLDVFIWSLWTSLVVAMWKYICRNRSCNNSHISINCITGRGKASMMLHTCIGAGHCNASQLILIMEWPNITWFAIFQYHLTAIAAMTCPYLYRIITLYLPLFLMRVVNTCNTTKFTLTIFWPVNYCKLYHIWAIWFKCYGDDRPLCYLQVIFCVSIAPVCNVSNQYLNCHQIHFEIF